MNTRAAVLLSTNEPLAVRTLEMPELSAGHVLVNVACSGVCRSQLMEVRGKRGEDRYLPHLLGHEGAGTVVAVGSGVSKVRPGDHVVLTWIKGSGMEAGGVKYRADGGWVNAGAVTTFSDYTVVSENRCVAIPAAVPFDIASLFGCAILTGSGIVLNSMKPTPEQTIAVWGLGGVGLSALIAAVLCGCKTIVAVDVEPSKLALAEALGATHTINARTTDAVEVIREITGGGVDFAVEAGGRTSTIEDAFRSVRKNGGSCVFASHPPAGEKIRLDPHELISGKRIAGSWGGESVPDRDIPRFADLYLQGRLPLERLITHRYPLDRINEALDDLEASRVGRALIELGEKSV